MKSVVIVCSLAASFAVAESTPSGRDRAGCPIDPYSVAVKRAAHLTAIYESPEHPTCPDGTCIAALDTDIGSTPVALACSDPAVQAAKRLNGASVVARFQLLQEHLRDDDLRLVLDARGVNRGETQRAYVEVSCLSDTNAVIRPLLTHSPVDAPTKARRTDMGIVDGHAYSWRLPHTCFQHGFVNIQIKHDNISPCLVATRLRIVTPKSLPFINEHSVEAYSDSVGINAGESVALHVHTPKSARVSARLYRVTDSVTEPLMFMGVTARGNAVRQDYSNDASALGVSWPMSVAIAVPREKNYKPGLYVASITDDVTREQFHVPFVVKRNAMVHSGVPPRLGVIASTNTWQAYNAWGGGSIYGKQCDLIDGIVSARRPNEFTHAEIDRLTWPAACPDCGGGGFGPGGERFVTGWLDHEKIPYEMLIDEDIHRGGDWLTRYSAVIISTHSEYWTPEMREHLRAFMTSGRNVVSLSGNTIFAFTAISADGTQLEHHRDGKTNEFGRLRGLPSGYWSDFPMLGGGVTSELGEEGIGDTPALLGTDSCQPYELNAQMSTDERKWLFDDYAGTEIGAGNSNSGGAPSSTRCLCCQAKATADRPMGAAGGEGDYVVSGNGPGVSVIGSEKRKGGGRHDIVLYRRPQGGTAFAVGSVLFGGSLRHDSALSNLLRNVILCFTDPKCPYASHPPR